MLKVYRIWSDLVKRGTKAWQLICMNVYGRNVLMIFTYRIKKSWLLLIILLSATNITRLACRVSIKITHFSPLRTQSGIRTRALFVLSELPLPLGYLGVVGDGFEPSSCQIQESNLLHPSDGPHLVSLPYLIITWTRKESNLLHYSIPASHDFASVS